MITIELEEITENPNDKSTKLLDDFAKYLEDEENIYVTDVDYSTKTIYVDTIEDLKKSRYILKTEFSELKQLGAHVLSTIGADGLDKDYIADTKTQTESLDDDFEQYSYIKSKDVYDSDGWRTEYTMYYDEVNDRYVFVFGDSDLYDPNDGYEEFDWECDTEREANEWFDNYNGFEDDLDESICNEALRYYVTDDDYIPLKAQPDEGYTKLQAIQRAQREAEQSAKLFKMRVADTAKWYHIMDSNNKILRDLDNAI